MAKERPIALDNCKKRNSIKPSGTETTQVTSCRVIREGIEVSLEFNDGKVISATCLTSVNCPHKS